MKIVAWIKKYVFGINKYVLVISLFLIVFLFSSGESNFFKRIKYDQQIQALRTEIEKYEKELEANKQRLESLKTDKEGLEKFAREEYRMKKSDEDLFVIKK